MTVPSAVTEVQVGDQLPAIEVPLRRENMIRYAGASGDFNPIHWDEAFAVAVGLPEVIAHGMLTMGIAVRVVTAWLGDPGAVLEYGVRFTRPVVVSRDPGATLIVSGKVRSVDTEQRRAVIDLSATVDGQTVLAQARATVRLPPAHPV
ncbi:MAG: dehydratase [Frankiales bacterium]|nr:dehydratase [Frankiales bacterium]